MDERHWLMGTVYNTGIECLQFVARFVATAPYSDCIDVLLTHLARHIWTRRRGGSRRLQPFADLYLTERLVRRRWALHR